MRYLVFILIMPFFVSCGNNKEEKKEMENQISEIATTNVNEHPNQDAVYFLLRHAEKDRKDSYNENPNLSIEGLTHAKRWAEYFAPIQLDEIYSTRLLRTRQTVSLIAQQKMITMKSYNAGKLYSDNFLSHTNHKHILIVGHSNTIPMLVNKLIGEDKFKEMDDNDNSTLYKVTIKGNDKKVETFTVK